MGIHGFNMRKVIIAASLAFVVNIHAQSGNIFVDENHHDYRITNVSHPPVFDHDAATKKYVDDAVAGGGITGPGSSTDNAIVRWDGTGGSAIQDSSIIIGDTGHITLEGVTSTGATGTGKFVFDTAPQISTIELGAASDTTMARSSAGHASIEGSVIGLASDTLSFFTTSTSNAIGVGTIELGHASDTTIARSSAGHVSVEGSVIGLASDNLGLFSSTTSSQFKGVISDENAPDGASSKVIMALGSLSIASGKTATFSNTLTFSGTDSSTLNIGSGGTLGSNAFTSTTYADNAFKTISVSGQSDVVADTATDTLTYVAGSNVTITTNASTDTVTFAASGGGGGTVVFSNPGGRLTTESGVAVSTSDRTSQGTLYYAIYKHNNIYTYSGSAWVAKTFAEISLSLTLTSGKNYDVFINSNADTLSLSSAWTNDTTRADALGTQDGVTVLSSDHTKLWLGTIRADGTNTIADSGGGTTTQVGGKRYVWNAYNQVRRSIKVIDTTDTWSYTTDTIRQANGASGNQVEYVTGDAAFNINATIVSTVEVVGNSAKFAKAGIGVDSTTTFSGLVSGAYVNAGGTEVKTLSAQYSDFSGLGYHRIIWNEKGADGTTCTFYGDKGANGIQSGLIAVGAF